MADSKVSPNAVTPKTRPPFERICPSDFFVPAVDFVVFGSVPHEPISA